MASPADSIRRSTGSSSSASLRRSDERQLQSRLLHQQISSSTGNDIPVETLVTHLLAAKRSLSSMTLVVRANDLATTARDAYEDAAIVSAHTAFLRNTTLDQAAILVRVRRGLQGTYDWAKKDFKLLVRAMDEVDGELERTMEMLRGTMVQSALRPKGEEPKCLLDFVDEESVEGMREAMKKSIQELQGIQQSFDGDLLRFDTDIRALKKVIVDSSLPRTEDEVTSHSSMAELLLGLIDNSSSMGQLLASLTKHFDMCVTAIRTTEGGAALARRRAAEAAQLQGGDGVSISGVIAEQESNMSDLEPKSENDRAEMLRVVVQDADEVNDVVQEIQERLSAMEQDYKTLDDEKADTDHAYLLVMEAHAILCGISDRLGDYLAAEEDFKVRWNLEKDGVFAKLAEMKDMRTFYEGYASAYDGLILEVDRRRVVQDRIKSIWKSAQDTVDKLLDTDRLAREAFRQDVGEYLPTDLWPGMHLPPRKWQVVHVQDEGQEERGG